MVRKIGITLLASSAIGAEGAVRLLFATEPGKRLLLASNRFPPGSPNLEKAIRFFQQQIAPRAVGSQEDRPRVY